MPKPNDLRTMSREDIKDYIRTLERQTKSEPIDQDQLDASTFFELEDIVTELEKERDLSKPNPS